MEKARLEGVGGSYEQFNTVLSAVVLTLTTFFFIWAVSFAWRELLCCCVKPSGKDIQNGVVCCKRNCIPSLKMCPRATLDCLMCRLSKKRRRKRRASKYALTKKQSTIGGVPGGSHDRSESAIGMIEGHASSDKIVIVDNSNQIVVES